MSHNLPPGVKDKNDKSQGQLLEWDAQFVVDEHEFKRKALELIGSSPYSLTHIARCLHIGRTTLYRSLNRQKSVLMRRAILDGLERLQR